MILCIVDLSFIELGPIRISAGVCRGEYWCSIIETASEHNQFRPVQGPLQASDLLHFLPTPDNGELDIIVVRVLCMCIAASNG